MRTLKEILDESKYECAKNNCQSCDSIALYAMEKALKEFKASAIDEIEDVCSEI